MKALHDQNHYEVLEVARSADLEDIERAYRAARATYDGDSLACYSVFDERETEAIRDRLETAYQVLRDGESRVAYDLTIEARSASPAPAVSDPLQHAWREVVIGTGTSEEELPSASESFRELEAEVEVDEEGAAFDGAHLRRARLHRGFELEQIADITKVSIANLRHIEDENVDDLPATVYVRGFVKAIASTIGLDPNRVATSYIERLERARETQGRSRFLGRS